MIGVESEKKKKRERGGGGQREREGERGGGGAEREMECERKNPTTIQPSFPSFKMSLVLVDNNHFPH